MAVARQGQRLRVRVEGVVQGVGFRPFAHGLARELGLAGWVRNDEHGVELEVEGTPAAAGAFLARLREHAPPLARVEGLTAEPIEPVGERVFRILASGPGASRPDALVAADAATCEECLRELADPRDRRYRYPFVNCTNCGPRFTIVRSVPYDRARTTMASFAMCAACRAEFEDPSNRRFHAQPNACPACGPAVGLLDAAGAALDRAAGGDGVADAVAATARLLADGAIVAVKGLGGYHLACRADREAPVAALRARKHRERRPFAVMVADTSAALALADHDECSLQLLAGPERPIVLAPRRPGAAIADALAPGSRELGAMLPYTPLHHLLLGDARALGVQVLVMTSGNRSEEPIAHRDEDALQRLCAIADAFLVHDRPIEVRTEDSVVRAVRAGGAPRGQLLRRSRGWVPAGVRLPASAPRPLLACGAELKSSFCIARGERAWVGPHVGDLRSWETLRSFREGVAHFEGLFGVRPRVVAHDLHPDYLSTRYALERRQEDEGLELLAVQHHHAHLAAVLAEHGELGPAAGAVFDGTGLGLDGTAWGGELLVGGLAGFERVGHLHPTVLPGGDAASREPWRMACAWLIESLGEAEPPLPAALARSVGERRWSELACIARPGSASPATTSVGRLFDAVAAICGAGGRISYEGQAAIELEAAADRCERGSYEMPFRDGRLDPRPTIVAALADSAAGVSRATVSARFHNTLARATADALERIAAEHRLGTVVLAGGVFANRLLFEASAERLARAGLRVLVPERLPPNDGAIAFGQAAIAAARPEPGLPPPRSGHG